MSRSQSLLSTNGEKGEGGLPCEYALTLGGEEVTDFLARTDIGTCRTFFSALKAIVLLRDDRQTSPSVSKYTLRKMLSCKH